MNTLEAYKKEQTDFRLKVVSSFLDGKGYFLRKFSSEEFEEQLDFLWEKNSDVKASITFAINKIEAVSLPQSPFGGIWIEKKLHSEPLEQFIFEITLELRKRGISKIRLVQAPKPYESAHDLINYLLFKSGFKQEAVLSHQFFIGKKKIKKVVGQGQSKFISRLKEGGLKITHSGISNFGFLQNIKNWNSQRGYSESVNEKRIISQVSCYPDRYFLITISSGEVEVAHTLAVRLTNNSLYYFLSAIDPKVPLKHGGELLLYQLFLLAVEQRVDLVDLGSSDLGTEVNHSLIFFKSRFSNDISNKITWIKNL